MDRLITTTVGGYPLVLDDVRFFLGQSGQSEGIYQALNNLLRTFGDDFIIQGAIANFTAKTITEGWIMFEGELLRVDAHNIGTNTHFSKVITFDSAGDKKARNGADIRAYQVNRGVVNATSGNLSADPDNITNRFEHKIVPAIRDEVNSAATQINKGLIEIATQAETLTGTDLTRALSPFGLNTRLPLVQKVMDIGDWNMDAQDSPAIQPIIHGLSLTKIRAIDVMVTRDNGANIYQLTFSDSVTGVTEGTVTLGAGGVFLFRRNGGFFDSAIFEDISPTLTTRGSVTIWHTL